jgi:carboxylesterase type B
VGERRPFSTGDRRLRLPEPLPPYEGNYEAHKYGPSCPQQRMLLPQGLDTRLEKDVNNIIAMMYEAVTEDSEDCKSPVLVYECAEHISIVRLDDQRCYA